MINRNKQKISFFSANWDATSNWSDSGNDSESDSSCGDEMSRRELSSGGEMAHDVKFRRGGIDDEDGWGPGGVCKGSLEVAG